MLKIIRYSLKDLSRSRWSLAYCLFYCLLGSTALILNNNLAGSLIFLLNVVIILSPLIGAIFGIIYYYNQLDFIQILLAQPVSRNTIVFGEFIGLNLSLILSFSIGLLLPFFVYGLPSGIFLLIGVGSILHLIFTGLAYLIALHQVDKIKGFAYAVGVWLLLAIVYDGAVVGLLVYFSEYPLETITILLMVINPIDLGRTALYIHLKAAALMGYTGAVFQSFFTSGLGILLSVVLLAVWVTVLLWRIKKKLRQKDF